MKWQRVKFKNFIQLQRGFDLPRSFMQEGEVPVLGSNCIIGYHNEAKVAPPGVVTGRSGTLGLVQYTDSPYWPHNTALWVKDFKGNNPKFVFYKLQTLNLESFNGGVSVPTLNRNVLDDLEIIIPNHEAQKQSAEILSAYDDLMENNRRRMVLLEDAARHLYREWFVRLRFPGHEHTHITNGVPEGWERKRMSDVAECVGGGTPSTANPAYWEEGDVTWVTPTDVTRNKHFVLIDTEKKITEAGLQNSSAKLVPAHSVLMTSRASVGYFAVAGREVCTNQGFISIVPRETILSPYLLFHLSERVEEIRAMGSGSTYPEVSRGKFREFEIVLPKHALAMEFGEQASFLLNQIRMLKQQNEKLCAARDLLLPRLMSGEIAV